MIAHIEEHAPGKSKTGCLAISLCYLLLVLIPGCYLPTFYSWAGTSVFMVVVLFSLRMWGQSLASACPRPPASQLPAILPKVTLIIASFDEEKALRRTIPSLLALDYPAEKIEFLYAYESASTDATELVIREFARQDARIRPLRRDGVPAGKAAIINFALRHATGEIVGIFDADHCLPPDLIAKAVRCFNDPTVACVRGRSRTANRHQNLLTSVVALERDVVERLGTPGADRLHGFTHFGGGHGFFNKQVLLAHGGFNEHVLTEDIHLSVRLHMAGLEIRAVPELESWEESPASLQSWIQQRKRWCRGWMQVWRAFAWQLLVDASMPWIKRFDTLVSLTSALGPVVTTAVFPLGVLAMAGVKTSVFPPPLALGLWIFATATPMLLALWCLLSDWRAGSKPRVSDVVALPVMIPYILALFIVGWICFVEEFILNHPFAYVKTTHKLTAGDENPPEAEENAIALEKSKLAS